MTLYDVKLEDVTVKYGNKVALEDITLHVPRADYLAVMGPNGAGKSTLLKTILGIAPLVKGKVEVLGKDPYRDKDVRKLIGYVPQRENVNERVPLRVIDVVMMGFMKGLKPSIPREEMVERSLKVLEEVGLLDAAFRLYSELSGGQKQRVLIARAIVDNPKLVLLDEPFSALDAQSSRLVANLLKKLNDEGKTIILVTHDIQPIISHVKRIALINKKLIALGSPKDVFTVENLRKAYGITVPVLTVNGTCLPLLGDQHER